VGYRENIQERLTIPSLTVIFTDNTLYVRVTQPYYSPFKTLASDHFAKHAPCLTLPKIVGTAISNELRVSDCRFDAAFWTCP
jgi:hypothetical protein